MLELLISIWRYTEEGLGIQLMNFHSKLQADGLEDEIIVKVNFHS